MVDSLTIAVSKGRILEQTLPLLERAGIRPADDPATTRKLVLDTNSSHVKLLVVRAQDVPTFVQYGAADLGVAGKDVLLEYPSEALYEPLDLKIARCRMVVAGRANETTSTGRLRVATKYVNTAARHFARQGLQAEVIRLYGSMEIAPLTGLADRIVDLVDTGSTLIANGLTEIETIAQISSRVIVNKAAMKMKHGPITELLTRLAEAVGSAKESGR